MTRWHQLFNGNLLSQGYLRGEILSQTEQRVLDKDISLWRERLKDISWFMRTFRKGL